MPAPSEHPVFDQLFRRLAEMLLRLRDQPSSLIAAIEGLFEDAEGALGEDDRFEFAMSAAILASETFCLKPVYDAIRARPELAHLGERINRAMEGLR